MECYDTVICMGNEFKWLLKEWALGAFSGVVIFLSKIHPPHRQLVYSLIYVILQSFLSMLAYANHLLVPPLTQWCFFDTLDRNVLMCEQV